MTNHGPNTFGYSKTMTNHGPNTFGYRALEKEMIYSFKLITKHTGRIAYPIPSYHIFFS